MPSKSMHLKIWFLAAALTALTACGGGSEAINSTPAHSNLQAEDDLITVKKTSDASGDSSTSVPLEENLVLTGQFLHRPAQGIRFTTDSQAGITNNNGHFQYFEGELVQFYIGGLLLGEAQGEAIVSLFDLVDGADAVTGNALRQSIDKSIPFNRVINIATLLHTLDRDGNPDNGIVLGLPVARLFKAGSINFDKRWDVFKDDLGLRGALAEAKTAGLLHNAVQIRQPWRALRQIYENLEVQVLLHPDARIEETDGEEFTELLYEYNSEGQRTQSQELKAGYTPITLNYEYDSHGNRTFASYWASILFFSFSGPTVSQFDNNGNLTRYQINPPSDDRSSSAIPFYDMTYKYNDLSQRLLKLMSTNEEPVNNALKYEYNSLGLLNRLTEDSDGDGAINSTTTFSYDNDDRITLKEEDSDFDGVTDIATNTVYDLQGNMIQQEVVSLLGGEANSVSVEVHSYDENGYLQHKEFFSNGNDYPDTIHMYEYDSNGNLTSEDSYDDGQLYRSQHYEYDSNDNLILKTIDENGDGINDVSIVHQLALDVHPWWTLFPGAGVGAIF